MNTTFAIPVSLEETRDGVKPWLRSAHVFGYHEGYSLEDLTSRVASAVAEDVGEGEVGREDMFCCRSSYFFTYPFQRNRLHIYTKKG